MVARRAYGQSVPMCRFVQDFGKADAIVAAIRAHLAGSRDVDPELPRWAGLTSLEDHAIHVAVRCHTSAKATHEYGALASSPATFLLLNFCMPRGAGSACLS